MEICNITFTGVDSETDLDALVNTAKNSIIPVEIGILFSVNQMGKSPRYMELKQINEVAKKLKERGIDTALHVCGRNTRGELSKLDVTNFSRVQINGKMLPLDFISVSRELVGQEIIAQFNEANAHVAAIVNGTDINSSLLVDRSSGRGISSDNWFFIPAKTVIETRGKLGFAGGINENNVIDKVKEVTTFIDSVRPDLRVWFDIESGVRNEEDRFSVEKISEILSKVNHEKIITAKTKGG